MPLVFIMEFVLFTLWYFFSFYAFIAGGTNGLKVFWSNNITPALTALGTCSSIATIPANLEATEKMQIPAHIRNIAIPLERLYIKTALVCLLLLRLLLFLLCSKRLYRSAYVADCVRDYNNSFSGRGRNSKWIHREILAITIYGFPMEQALPAAMIVGTLVDPMATLLNANGDVVSAITRISEGKKWLSNTLTT
jgi:Na+/serine symporter